MIYRIGGVLAGLDLFGSERSFARTFPKLVRGSALQALAGFDSDGGSPTNDQAFLTTVLSATGDRFPAVGLGEEVRIDTDEIGGAALELNGALVHLFAFRRSKSGLSETNRRMHAS